MKNFLSAVTVILLLTSCIDNKEPEGLGLRVKKIGPRSAVALKECRKGNCNVSFKKLADESRYIEPIKYHEDKDQAINKIMGIVLKDKTLNIIKSDEKYIRAKQELYGKFISDLEFFFGSNKQVHMRIEMRGVPHDLGNGRRLLEKIRFKFQQNDF